MSKYELPKRSNRGAHMADLIKNTNVYREEQDKEFWSVNQQIFAEEEEDEDFDAEKSKQMEIEQKEGVKEQEQKSKDDEEEDSDEVDSDFDRSESEEELDEEELIAKREKELRQRERKQVKSRNTKGFGSLLQKSKQTAPSISLANLEQRIDQLVNQTSEATPIDTEENQIDLEDESEEEPNLVNESKHVKPAVISTPARKSKQKASQKLYISSDEEFDDNEQIVSDAEEEDEEEVVELKTPKKRGKKRKNYSEDNDSPVATPSSKRKSNRSLTQQNSEEIERRLEEKEYISSTRKKKRTKTVQHLSQEQLLAEAKITAEHNKQSLENLMQMEEDKKSKSPFIRDKSKSSKIPLIHFSSKDGVQTIGFRNFPAQQFGLPDYLAKNLQLQNRHDNNTNQDNKFCLVFADKIAKYKDPKSRVCYSNADAFRVIRYLFSQYEAVAGTAKNPTHIESSEEVYFSNFKTFAQEQISLFEKQQTGEFIQKMQQNI